MKIRFELLGMLVLLPLASLSLAPSRAQEAPGVPASEPFEQRPAPMMGDLIFDHEEHAEEMDLDCDECHHETNAAPLDFPHEQYFHDLWIDCDICHREAGSPDLEPQSCYDCHDSKLRDIADERLSSKVILHQSCWACHEVETGVEASESCEDCHTGMQEEL